VERSTRRTLLARAGIAGAALTVAGLPRGLLGAADALADTNTRLPIAWGNELAAAMRGNLLYKDNPRYLAAQPLFNSRFDSIFPQAIARPIDEADVQTIMRWAARHDVRIIPRGGGHGYTGNAIASRGLVVDLRALKGVVLGDGGRTATLGGGTLSIDATSALSAAKVVVPTGTCPSVGFTGLAMGGGIGALSRMHGLTTDRISAVTIVTPDGQLRTVDQATEPELFWACRGGGGGNVGIVTRLQVQTAPAVPETQITIHWPWSASDAVLEAFLRTAPVAPDELTGDLAFSMKAGGKPPTVQYVGCYLGPPAQVAEVLAPLLAIPGAVLKSETTTRLKAALSAGDCDAVGVAACRPSRFGTPGILSRQRFFASSGYLSGPLDATSRKALLEAIYRAAPWPGGSRSILLAAHGGAIARVAPEATAFPHRAAWCSVQFFARSAGLWEDASARSWVHRARPSLGAQATGGAYVNYLDADQPDWQTAYYGASLERLKAVKAQFDPDGRFRPAQGIPTL
jgi:FAD/FMN-containing dehydrogenase